MAKNLRKEVLFGVGLLVGVAAGAIGMLSLRGGDGPYASSPPTRAMGAAPSSTAFVTAVAGNCEMAPVLPAAGDGDGSEVLQAKPGAGTADEVGALILTGKEAAAAGHRRDAEVAFLNACRSAAALTDGDPIPLADAMYQLGRHYANVAALGGAGQGRELFQRSERLYSASLEAYRARYGDAHEKTKFAREGLTTVQQATGGKAPTAIAKVQPRPAPVPPAAPEPDLATPEPAAVAAAPVAPAASAASAASAPAPKVAKAETKPKPEARRVEPRVERPEPRTEVAPEPEPPPVVATPRPRPRPAPRPRVEPEPEPLPAPEAPAYLPPPIAIEPTLPRLPPPVATDSGTPPSTASGSTGMGAAGSSGAEESY